MKRQSKSRRDGDATGFASRDAAMKMTEAAVFEISEAEARATELVSLVTKDVTDPVWRRELAGLAYTYFRKPIVAALSSTLQSDDTPDQNAGASEPQVYDAHVSFIAESVSRSEGRVVSGRWTQTARQVFFSFAASLICLFLILRYRGSSPAILPKVAILAAVHGERSNRTIPMHAALGRHTDVRTALLLGRPHNYVSAAHRAFDSDGSLDDLLMLRPMDVRAWIAAIPQMCRVLVQGITAVRQVAFLVPAKEQLALCYRFVQGTVHSAWWSRVPASNRPEFAVFAHTGPSDSTLLEVAMQESGVRTVHAIHGTNTGWPFSGFSDLALFQTGADARLGETLPEYGRCTHQSMQEPSGTRRRDGSKRRWALLTSYTHLRNQAYVERGADPDIAVIEWMKVAASKHAMDPDDIFWRPHPQIELVDPEQRERLIAAVQNAGFRRWSANIEYRALGKFDIVVTTPSTAMIDALRLGQTPIVAASSSLQLDMVYNRYPLLAKSAEQLLSFVGSVSDRREPEILFRQAWAPIEPARALDLSETALRQALQK